jgi:transcriptional regulator with XRE-family HTH domain
MERPGEKLKRVRERLKLTYRDVEAHSQTIAARRGSDEYAIALSRLADIENKGTLPTIYRLYTLCAIYRLDFEEVLAWFGVPLEHWAADALHVPLSDTHLVHLRPSGHVPVPQPSAFDLDLNKTVFLNHLFRRWGKMPLAALNGLELRKYQYAYIGLSDRTMYPLLRPGSLVVIDENRRRIASGGWTNEFDRPIYFLEHREAYLCGWCAIVGNKLVLEAHPASGQKPCIFEYPAEIDVIGQVTAAAMPLESGTHSARPSATPAGSPSP